MPRYRNASSFDLEEFVAPIMKELHSQSVPTPSDPLAAAGQNPVIIETSTGLGEKFRVTVVWDRWGGIPVEDRNRIIMEAYRRVVGAEAVNISLALGVTKSQYNQMHTTTGQLLGA